MKSIKFYLIIVFLFMPAILFAQDMPDPETRGTWVTGNFLKGGTDGIETMVQNLSKANFNTIFVDVWYNGYTIYPSSVISSAGGPLQNPQFTGTDPLKTTIEIAHKYKMEVFAWFEFGFAVGYGISLSDPPAIIKQHPDWSMLSREGKIGESDDYGGYFFWIDPAVSKAADFMVDLYTECARKYPDLDGIELDRMRYPYKSYSYSDTARARFVKETGNSDPLSLADNNSAWSSWRRLQVTNVVKRIYDNVKKVNPRCVMTGAVVPPYMMYGQSDDKLQAWDIWAKNSYVDILEPMLYLPTSDYNYQLNLCKNYVPYGFQLAPGIAISSAGSTGNTISEIQTTRTAGFQGEIIWYYGDLLSYSDALPKLKSSTFTQSTAPTHSDLIIDNSSKGLFKTKGQWTTESGGYKGSYLKASSGPSDTAIYSTRILRSDNYSLFGYWTGDSSSNCEKAIITISTANTSQTDTLNQKTNLNRWNFIDKIFFNSGDTVTIKLSGSASGNLISDAFRLKSNSTFSLIDYFMADSQTVKIKFSDKLLAPVSGQTKIISTNETSVLSYNVDPINGNILQINISPLPDGQATTIKIDNLYDAAHNSLSLSLSITYSPKSSEFTIDDQKQDSFWKVLGTWTMDTSYQAFGNTYWLSKQSDKVSRVQWGPLTVTEDGYYDVFVKIPQIKLPLADKCFYVVHDRKGTDTAYISQSSVNTEWFRLGNFPYKAGDVFAVMLSSITNADTSKYLIADAVKLKRALENTSVKASSDISGDYTLFPNYPNPFNPSTTISFFLKEEAKVTIRIYNSLGQQIQLLSEGKIYMPGNWKVEFNGDDLPSGIYFAVVKIETGKNEKQKILKMALIK